MIEINKIYNENCLVTMENMENNFIDLTVTSPPYDNLRSYKNNVDESWNEDVWKPIIKELYRVTKEGGVVVWIVGDATIKGSETGTSFKQALWAIECGFKLHDTMIWKKTGCAFYDRNRYGNIFEYMFIFSKGKPKTYDLIRDRKNKWAGTQVGGTQAQKDGTKKPRSKVQKSKKIKEFGQRWNVWEITTTKERLGHPAVFPDQLASDHIISWSNEGDLVYDPFGGSGTTAKMAVVNNRNYIMSEISKEYCEIIKNRIQKTT